LWSWFVVGIPVLPIAFFIFITNKEPSLVSAITSAAICRLFYNNHSALLIKFLQEQECRDYFN